MSERRMVRGNETDGSSDGSRMGAVSAVARECASRNSRCASALGWAAFFRTGVFMMLSRVAPTNLTRTLHEWRLFYGVLATYIHLWTYLLSVCTKFGCPGFAWFTRLLVSADGQPPSVLHPPVPCATRGVSMTDTPLSKAVALEELVRCVAMAKWELPGRKRYREIQPATAEAALRAAVHRLTVPEANSHIDALHNRGTFQRARDAIRILAGSLSWRAWLRPRRLQLVQLLPLSMPLSSAAPTSFTNERSIQCALLSRTVFTLMALTLECAFARVLGPRSVSSLSAAGGPTPLQLSAAAAPHPMSLSATPSSSLSNVTSLQRTLLFCSCADIAPTLAC